VTKIVSRLKSDGEMYNQTECYMIVVTMCEANQDTLKMKVLNDILKP